MHVVVFIFQDLVDIQSVCIKTLDAFKALEISYEYNCYCVVCPVLRSTDLHKSFVK